MEREEPAGPAGRLLGVLVLLGALGPGCESRFVDPYPPELELLDRALVVEPRDAPLVYGLIFDLNLPDATECARVKSQLTSRLRSALLPAGREGLELPVQDVSPGCQQLNARQLPASNYEAGVREARQRFGAARVKPVLFYFNNVDLSLPAVLQSQLNQLRSGAPGPALFWGLTLPEARTGFDFDQKGAWTYSADGRLTTLLEDDIRLQLPLRMLEAPADGLPLFTPQEASAVRAFKGCTRSPKLQGVNFTYTAETVTLDPLNPPRLRMDITGQAPLPRTHDISKVTVRLQVEVCRDHCERLYPAPPDGDLTVWSTAPHCLLSPPP